MGKRVTECLPADSPWWARWMIAEWQQAWKWFSVQGLAFIAIAPEIIAATPQLHDVLPDVWLRHLTGIFALCVIVGRLMAQRTKSESNIIKETKP